MAITVTDRGNGKSNYGNTDPFTASTTFPASAGDLIIVAFHGINVTEKVTSGTSHGQSLTLIDSSYVDTALEVWAVILTGTPGSGSVSLDITGNNTAYGATYQLEGDFSGYATVADAFVDIVKKTESAPSSEWVIGTLDGSGDITMAAGCNESGGNTYTLPSGYEDLNTNERLSFSYDAEADTTPSLAFTGSTTYKTFQGIGFHIAENAGGGSSNTPFGTQDLTRQFGANAATRLGGILQ